VTARRVRHCYTYARITVTSRASPANERRSVHAAHARAARDRHGPTPALLPPLLLLLLLLFLLLLSRHPADLPRCASPSPPPPPPFADTIGERLYPAFTSGAGDFTRLQRCSSKRAVNTASRMHRNRYYSIASSVVASVSRD